MITDALRVFVTVVEQQHFSKAGELLNLSQPGVSLHIRNLENEFAVKLLHRSPSKCVLLKPEPFYISMRNRCSCIMKRPAGKSGCCRTK